MSRAIGILLLTAWIAMPAVDKVLAQTTARSQAQLDGDLQRAVRYERSGNLIEALNLYRELMAFPGSRSQAYEGAVRVCPSLERWEDLETIVRERLSENPGDVEAHLFLGLSLARRGKNSDAREVWEKAAELPGDRARVLERASRFAEEAGMIREAISFLALARDERGISTLHALELAGLYLNAGNIEPAIRELLAWLEVHPQQEGVVQGELRRILWDPETNDQAREILQKEVKGEHDATHLNRVVVGLWIEMGWCEEALDLASAARVSSQATAVSFVSVGDACAERGCVEAAVRAYRIASEGVPHERGDALLKLGRLLMDLGRDQEALRPFEKFLETFPDKPGATEARYGIGRALLRIGRPEEALAHLRRLIESRTDGSRVLKARFLVAECLIGLDRIDEAAAQLEEVSLEERGAGEEFLYRRGEILFLAGRFEGALESYRTAIERFPKGEYVNNALARVLLIGENQVEGEDALALYAGALYFGRLGQWAQALAQMDLLLRDYPYSSLADDALLARAEVQTEAGDFRGAIGTLDRLLSEYPESRHAASAAMRKGDIHLETLDNPSAARDAYEMLLMRYPESPLLDHARRKLRAIEETVP